MIDTKNFCLEKTEQEVGLVWLLPNGQERRVLYKIDSVADIPRVIAETKNVGSFQDANEVEITITDSNGRTLTINTERRTDGLLATHVIGFDRMTGLVQELSSESAYTETDTDDDDEEEEDAYYEG